MEHAKRGEHVTSPGAVFSIVRQPGTGRIGLGFPWRAPTIIEPDGSFRELNLLRKSNPNLYQLAWSKAGNRIACPRADGTVAIYDVETGNDVALLPLDMVGDMLAQKPAVRFLTFADDDQVVVALRHSGELIAWDVATKTIRWKLAPDGPGYPSALLVCPADRHVLVSRQLQNPFIVDARTGSVVRDLGDRFPQHGIAFSPDGALVYGQHGSYSLVALHWPSCETKSVWPQSIPMGLGSSAISPDGSRWAAMDRGQNLCLRDTRTGRLILTFDDLPSEGSETAWSQDGSILYGANQGRNICGLIRWRGAPAGATAVQDTIDLLACCRPTDQILGRWIKADHGGIVGESDAHLVLEVPAMLFGSYRLEAEAVRLSERGSLGLLLPVGLSRCDFEVAGYWGDGYLTGLDEINHQDMRARSDSVLRGYQLETGRPIKIEVDVQVQAAQATIRADLDGRTVANWSGPISSLSTHSRYTTPLTGAPGLIGYGGKIEFRKLKLVANDGEYELLAQPDREGPKAKLAGPGDNVNLLPLGGSDSAKGAQWTPRGTSRILRPTEVRGHCSFAMSARGSYEIHATFRRTAGTNTVAFMIPCPDDRQAVVAFDATQVNDVAGRSLKRATVLLGIPGLDVWGSSYPARREGIQLQNGKNQKAVIRVQRMEGTQLRLSVSLDGQQMFAWEGDARSLNRSILWYRPPERWLSIGTGYGTTVVFDKLELKMLDGDATLYPPPATQPSTMPTPRAALKEPVDLLASVNLERDVIGGTWRKDPEGTIVSDQNRFARLALRYQLPDEYDYFIDFERLSGNNSVSQVCSAGDTHFEWCLGGSSSTVCYLGAIAGKVGKDSPASVMHNPFASGRRHTALVQVRRGGIKCHVDGKLLVEHKTKDFLELSEPEAGFTRFWPGEPFLGLRTFESPTRFYKAELRPPNDEGER